MSLDDDEEETPEKEVAKEKIEAEEVSADAVVAKTETVEPIVATANKKTTAKKKIKEAEDSSPSIGELAEENRRLQEENSKLTDLLNTKSQVPQQESQQEVKPATVSGLLNELFQLVKEERVAMMLSLMQEDYFKLKYKTHSQEELTKLRIKISERFLEQDLEGRVDAARKINKK